MRRRVTRYAELTSLLDVLFILLFASLIQAAGVVSKAEEEPPAVAPPVEPPPEPVRTSDHAELRQRAIDELTRSIGSRSAVYARISGDGTLTAIERDHGATTQRLEVATPLLTPVDDPNVRVVYLGERRPEWRLCTRIRVTLGLADLHDRLVVFALDAPLAMSPVALVEGLRADEEHCFADEGGIAIVLPPESSR